MTALTQQEECAGGGRGDGNYRSPFFDASKQSGGEPAPRWNRALTRRAPRLHGPTAGPAAPQELGARPTPCLALEPHSPVTMATVVAADRPCAGRAGQTCLHGSSHYAAEPGTMKSEAGGCGGEDDDEFGTFVAAGDRVEWEEFGVCQRREQTRETGSLRPEKGPLNSTPSPGAGWRAFTDEDEDTLRCHSLRNRCSEAESHDPGPTASPDKGQWWFGDGAEQRLKASCTVQRSSSQYKDSQSSLRNIFENCFPPEPLTVLKEDVQPLEVLLSSQAKTRGSDPHLRQAACLFKSLMDRKHTFNLRTKWAESYSQKAYMEVLQIDQTSKIHPAKPKPFVDSPKNAKKIEGRKLLVASTGYDKELKLTKVTDTSIPVNGFSPSHHLQTFFQHWMQSSGKKKLKMAYDFNRSLLV